MNDKLNMPVYFIYILTNPGKTALYIGVTNNVAARIMEHWEHRGQPDTFAGKYYCYNLVYLEAYHSINAAIDREKELKKWRREKKMALIHLHNPDWVFLNEEVCGDWPPPTTCHR